MKHLAILNALIRFYFRIIPSDWHRRFPYIPVPRARYVRWRLDTAYGKGRRPGFGVILSDMWQFGGWLAGETARDRGRTA